MKICFTHVVLIISFLFVSKTHSQINYTNLDSNIQSAIDSFQQPGLAVGIIKNGKIEYAKGFGVKSTETKEAVDLETLFGIASLSKAFTAASIGMLVDEGKLDWNDRVVDHLPWFKLHDPYITREIRIKDLLSHRVGLATFDGDLLWYGTNYSRMEIVKRIKELPIKNSFRDKYGYQNVMFIVAGELIKEVSGKTWEEFIKERIFKPLGMNNSTLTNSTFDKNSNIAIPHRNGKTMDFINYDNSGPAASINSCVSDMLKWAQFWINKGKVDTTVLLSEKSYYEITKSYMALNGGKGEEIGGTHFVTTGLGWFLSDYAGRKTMTHGGGLPGFLSTITVVPEDSLGIVIFQNDETPLFRAVSKKILDIMLTDKDVDYVAQSIEKSKKQKARKVKSKAVRDSSRILNTNPSFTLEKYVGVYTDKMYGDAEVKMDNKDLSITLLPTAKLFTSKMTHWHFDTFRLKFNDPFLPEGFVTFNKNSRGEITDFIIDLPNPDFHFYNLMFVSQ